MRTNAGSIRISFEKRGNRTVAIKTYRDVNLRISSNESPDPSLPFYFLVATGGGYAEGEHYLQEITAGDDTHASVTTQTPTYIYRCDNGIETVQESRYFVGRNAFLELYMDEVIPYPNACYKQRSVVHLAPGAVLILTDGLTGGWSPDGKSFAARCIDQGIRVFREERLIYQDHLYLDMTAEKMQEMGFFGRGNTNYNVVTVLDESVDQQMVERIRKTLSDLHYSGTWGVSLLPEGGFTFRVLSEDGPKNYSLMAALIRTFRETEKGLPPLRSSKAERSRMRPYNSIECAGNRADTRLFVQDSKI